MQAHLYGTGWDFPSFLEGLSLRRRAGFGYDWYPRVFPFLFGGAFIEAPLPSTEHPKSPKFPFLIGGAFIEA